MIEEKDELANKNLQVGVLHMHTIKPLDHESLRHWLPKVGKVVTVEEHSRIGGLGSAVLEYASDHLPEVTHKIKRIGLPDHFSENYGSQASLLTEFGITKEALVESFANSR